MTDQMQDVEATSQKLRPTIAFTGEFFVPGMSGERIEADHIERYRFATLYARGKRVLDIACGVGYSSPLLLAAGAVDYQGVDINPEVIDYARHTYGSARAKYFTGDIRGFAGESEYDLIVSFETIEHVPDFRSALKNLYSRLATGGQLLVSSPNRPITSPEATSLAHKPANPFHTQEFTPPELIVELRHAGFSVDDRNVFGQRQRRVFSNHFLRRLAFKLQGDPDINTSPKVTRVTARVPRYFVLVATKQCATR